MHGTGWTFRRGNIETCITTSSKRLSCSAVIHDGRTRLLCLALMFAMLWYEALNALVGTMTFCCARRVRRHHASPTSAATQISENYLGRSATIRRNLHASFLPTADMSGIGHLTARLFNPALLFRNIFRAQHHVFGGFCNKWSTMLTIFQSYNSYLFIDFFFFFATILPSGLRIRAQC